MNPELHLRAALVLRVETDGHLDVDVSKKRIIKLAGAEITRTPLLVPSFSSKGFPEVDKITKTMEEVIENVTLISAYDLHYKKIKPPFDFASVLLFLDSGGYEASKDAELADFGERDHRPAKWSQKMHEDVLTGWQSPIPTVFISYDHPKERLSVRRQIARAKQMVPEHRNIIREILLKPETKGQTLLNVDSVISNIRALSDFDIIGITEKEIGNSIFNRMENIAKLRIGLNKAGLDDTPIHIFGSLDTITTPMYFLAGADIFDGLTWLRFAYHNGYTMYKHNYGALELGLKTRAHIIDGRTWNNNYRYLVDLELELRRFLNGHHFSSFKYHSALFRNAYNSMLEAVRS